MKNVIVWLTLVLCMFVVLFTSCRLDTPDVQSNIPLSQDNLTSEEKDSESSQPIHSNNFSSESPSKTGTLPEYKAGSIKLEPQDQDDYAFIRKYRIAYYQIWGEFAELLSEEEYQDYMEWIDKKAKQDGHGEFQDEMLLVSFVKRYNIPREEFNQAVEKYIANSKAAKCDLSAEPYEVPNGDIIYTFDNEVINRYYRYE